MKSNIKSAFQLFSKLVVKEEKLTFLSLESLSNSCVDEKYIKTNNSSLLDIPIPIIHNCCLKDEIEEKNKVENNINNQDPLNNQVITKFKINKGKPLLKSKRYVKFIMENLSDVMNEVIDMVTYLSTVPMIYSVRQVKIIHEENPDFDLNILKLLIYILLKEKKINEAKIAYNYYFYDVIGSTLFEKTNEYFMKIFNSEYLDLIIDYFYKFLFDEFIEFRKKCITNKFKEKLKDHLNKFIKNTIEKINPISHKFIYSQKTSFSLSNTEKYIMSIFDAIETKTLVFNLANKNSKKSFENSIFESSVFKDKDTECNETVLNNDKSFSHFSENMKILDKSNSITNECPQNHFIIDNSYFQDEIKNDTITESTKPDDSIMDFHSIISKLIEEMYYSYEENKILNKYEISSNKINIIKSISDKYFFHNNYDFYFNDEVNAILKNNQIKINPNVKFTINNTGFNKKCFNSLTGMFNLIDKMSNKLDLLSVKLFSNNILVFKGETYDHYEDKDEKDKIVLINLETNNCNNNYISDNDGLDIIKKSINSTNSKCLPGYIDNENSIDKYNGFQIFNEKLSNSVKTSKSFFQPYNFNIKTSKDNTLKSYNFGFNEESEKSVFSNSNSIILFDKNIWLKGINNCSSDNLKNQYDRSIDSINFCNMKRMNSEVKTCNSYESSTSNNKKTKILISENKFKIFDLIKNMHNNSMDVSNSKSDSFLKFKTSKGLKKENLHKSLIRSFFCFITSFRNFISAGIYNNYHYLRGKNYFQYYNSCPHLVFVENLVKNKLIPPISFPIKIAHDKTEIFKSFSSNYFLWLFSDIFTVLIFNIFVNYYSSKILTNIYNISENSTKLERNEIDYEQKKAILTENYMKAFANYHFLLNISSTGDNSCLPLNNESLCDIKEIVNSIPLSNFNDLNIVEEIGLFLKKDFYCKEILCLANSYVYIYNDIFEGKNNNSNDKDHTSSDKDFKIEEINIKEQNNNGFIDKPNDKSKNVIFSINKVY